MSDRRHPIFQEKNMNRTDKMIKRCRALALAGVLGLASLGNAVPALAAGPGDDASRVTEISAGGP